MDPESRSTVGTCTSPSNPSFGHGSEPRARGTTCKSATTDFWSFPSRWRRRRRCTCSSGPNPSNRSSGKSHPADGIRRPTSGSLANAPAWIGALGFAIGGKAENYHRLVQPANAADIGAIAKTVVKIFYSGFDYRGTAPIMAKLVHEGRSETRATFDSFTPEDVSKVFAGRGYRVEEPVGEDREGVDTPPMIRCRKRGTYTTLKFDERVGEENLYRRVRFSAELDLPEKERARLKASADTPEGAEPIGTLSIVHALGGGVTLAWLIERTQEWEGVLV